MAQFFNEKLQSIVFYKGCLKGQKSFKLLDCLSLESDRYNSHGMKTSNLAYVNINNYPKEQKNN